MPFCACVVLTATGRVVRASIEASAFLPSSSFWSTTRCPGRARRDIGMDAAAHVCPVCKSTDFDETEDGALTCVECGTQVFGVRAEVNEQGLDGAGVSSEYNS